MPDIIDKERAIRSIVSSAVKSYANGFSTRHLAEVDDENGVINMKIHNVFIATLGSEIQYYSNLNCLFEKSFERLFRDMALSIENFVYGGAQHETHSFYCSDNEQKNVASYWSTVCNDSRGYEIVMDELDKELPIRM